MLIRSLWPKASNRLFKNYIAQLDKKINILFQIATDKTPSGLLALRHQLDSGLIDINARHRLWNTTLLETAAAAGSVSMVRHLVEVRNAAMSTPPGRDNLLYFAAMNSDPTVLTYLARSTQVARFNDGTTALHGAACRDLAAVKRLAVTPQTTNIRNTSGKLPIYYAALAGSEAIVSYLVSYPGRPKRARKASRVQLALGLRQRAQFISARFADERYDVDVIVELNKITRLYQFFLSPTNQDLETLAHCYLNIGTRYGKVIDAHDKMLDAFDKGITFAEKISDPERRYLILHQLYWQQAQPVNCEIFSARGQAAGIKLRQLYKEADVMKHPAFADSAARTARLDGYFSIVSHAANFGYQCIDSPFSENSVHQAIAGCLLHPNQQGGKIYIGGKISDTAYEHIITFHDVYWPLMDWFSDSRQHVLQIRDRDGKSIALLALSRSLNTTICIIDETGRLVVIRQPTAREIIFLGLDNDQHYYTLTPAQHGAATSSLLAAVAATAVDSPLATTMNSIKNGEKQANASAVHTTQSHANFFQRAIGDTLPAKNTKSVKRPGLA